MRVRWRRILIVAAIGAAALSTPVLYWLGTAYYSMVRERWHRTAFDSAAWQDVKQVESHDPVRIRMVDSLISSRRLDGISREEVEKLLGKSDDTEYFKAYDAVYWLGPERGFIGIDSEWLVITYDAHGKVRSHEIVRD